MILLHELSKLTRLRRLETHVTWVNGSLRNVKAILHIQNHSLASLDCLIANIEHFVEVLIQAFVTIDLKYVLHAVQESVKCGLVLKHKQVEQVCYSAPLMWQIFGKLVSSVHSQSDVLHLICKLLPHCLSLQNTIYDTVSCCFLFLQMLLNLFRMITMTKSVDIFLDLCSLDCGPELSASQNLVLHLEHHMAWRIVSSHVVLESEDAQNKRQVFE